MRSIPEVLSHQAKAAAARPALLAVDGTALDYAGLLDQVRSLAAQLRALNVSDDQRVGVVLSPGLEMAVTFLAVSSTAACAPLNPAYRRSDFDFYLDDLAPTAVVVPEESTSPVVEAALERGIRVIRLVRTANGKIELRPQVSTSGNGREHAGAIRWSGADDVALLLHTSGTTSRPKIVPLTHANLCTSAHQVAQTLALTAADRCLNVMPLFHIHGLVGGLLSSLVSGGAVVCCPGFQADRFLAWATTLAPTWYTAVPTIHQSVLEQADKDPNRAKEVHFRFIRSSSASLPPTLLEAMERQWNAPVIEAYGMTEASHQITSNPIPPLVRKPGSVGRPTGIEVSVVDESGAQLAPGERGEVVIRGPSVTAGYEGQSPANAEAFRDGWFRTGDQGYLDEAGYLFLTGRLKEMINRGGEKIAPREIDEVLLRHEAVVQAVAFAAPHETLGEDVLAAVVLRAGRSADEHDLRHFVAQHLSDFKVPSRIIAVESIPKGPTGKTQRIGLHALLKPQLETEFSDPASEEERWVARAFASVLNQERVGRDDNFFALGGDSIRAVRVAIELAAPLGHDLPVATLFEYPTPQLLGAELRRLREADAELDELARALSGLAPDELERLLSGDGSTERSR